MYYKFRGQTLDVVSDSRVRERTVLIDGTYAPICLFDPLVDLEVRTVGIRSGIDQIGGGVHMQMHGDESVQQII